MIEAYYVRMKNKIHNYFYFYIISFNVGVIILILLLFCVYTVEDWDKLRD